MASRTFEGLFEMSWPDGWTLQEVKECTFRLHPPGGGGRLLEVWYSPMPGVLQQDEMDEWVNREVVKFKRERGLESYLGGVWSAAGPCAVLQGLTNEDGRTEWHVQMFLAIPRVLLTGEYHHPVGYAAAAMANIGAVKGEIEEAIRVFFSTAATKQ
ncbi:MAG TPA: hypothetical protein VI893_07540 [Thermoplasmata archaeon]|nr:hypothetical protein [Thermoplasmata archaeon]